MYQSAGLGRMEKSLPSARAFSRASREPARMGSWFLVSRRLISVLRIPRSRSFRSHCISLGSSLSPVSEAMWTVSLSFVGAAASSFRYTVCPAAESSQWGKGEIRLCRALWTSIMYSTCRAVRFCSPAVLASSKEQALSAVTQVVSTTASSLMPEASRLVISDTSSWTHSGNIFSSSQTPAKI